MALSLFICDGQSYSQLGSLLPADSTAGPASFLSFHLYPTLPFTYATGKQNTVVLHAAPSPQPTSSSTCALSLSLRSYDSRLLVACAAVEGSKAEAPSIVLISASPVRSHAWTSVQLFHIDDHLSLTVVDHATGRTSDSRCAASSLAPFTASSRFWLAGSASHDKDSYYTGYIASPSLSALSSLPLPPAYPASSALPPLPTRSLPLHSVSALSAVPWSPLQHASGALWRPRPSCPPWLLHCHDMRGGYTDDAHAQGLRTAASYAFSHWAAVDVLVYFSHARITLPPAAWIHAAHKEGVRVLGTLIVEWEEGEKDAAVLVLSGGLHAEALVRLCLYHGFDGWLVNMEAALPVPLLPLLSAFMSRLQQLLHEAVPHGLLLWYDALSAETGRVQWQSHLHPSHTAPFLQLADGVFLDYHWQPQQVAASAAAAAHRRFDLYTGIDVWGRGTYGGGGWSVGQALDVVLRGGADGGAQTSAALFGAGWTLEALQVDDDRRRWEMMERRFWLGDDVLDVPLATADCTDLQQAMQGWQLLQDRDADEDDQQQQRLMDRWALVDDDERGRVVVTSHRWCRRRREVDLAAYGITPSMLSCSPLLLSLPHRGTPPNTADTVRLSVQLLSASRAVLMQRELELTCSAQWATATMSLLCPDARYLQWEEAGKDAEHWAGHYGCRLGRARLQLRRGSSSSGGIASYIRRRAPLQLPLLYDFNAGYGSARWVEGRKVGGVDEPVLNVGQTGRREGDTVSVAEGAAWSSLQEQDVQTFLCDGVRGGQTQRGIDCRLTDEAAYEGGMCLQVTPAARAAGGDELEAEFEVLQFAAAAADAAQPGQAEDVVVRATVMEGDGMELGVLLLLAGGGRLHLRGSTSCRCDEAGAGWRHFTATESVRPADIIGLNLRVLCSATVAGCVSYLGQLYINTVGADRSVAAARGSSRPSLSAVVHWPVLYAHVPQQQSAVYVAWLAPQTVQQHVVQYELRLAGRYVGATRRNLYVMEAVDCSALDGQTLHISWRYADGSRHRAGHTLRLRLSQPVGEEQLQGRAAFAAAYCAAPAVELVQQCAAMGLDCDDDGPSRLRSALLTDAALRLGAVSAAVRDCINSVYSTLGYPEPLLTVRLRHEDDMPRLVVSVSCIAARDGLRQQLLSALSQLPHIDRQQSIALTWLEV